MSYEAGSKECRHLIDLIFNKLKDYKKKNLFLERENLNKFILSLLKEN